MDIVWLNECGLYFIVIGIVIMITTIIDIHNNIIKWPMPLGARPRSIKNVKKIL